MNQIYDIKPAKKKKVEIGGDDLKTEALKEIGRNPLIKNYFRTLILGYNENIIKDSRPPVLVQNHDRLIQWHAKKDQLERMLEAIKEIRESDETNKPI